MELPPDYEIVQNPDYVWKKGDIYGLKNENSYDWKSYIDGLAGTTTRKESRQKLIYAVAKKTKKTVYDNSDFAAWGNDYIYGEPIKPYQKEVIGKLVDSNKYKEILDKFAGYQPKKTKPKKTQELAPPAGYSLVSDDNYVIKEDDLYNLETWNNNDFLNVEKYCKGLINKSLGVVLGIYRVGFGKVTIAIKAPRFKSDKPFPWGY